MGENSQLITQSNGCLGSGTLLQHSRYLVK